MVLVALTTGPGGLGKNSLQSGTNDLKRGSKVKRKN